MTQTTLERPRTQPGRTVAIRADIQALRAIAVAAVLGYHLWPTRLSGAFAGVDVFFVISGFLITSHLLAHLPVNPRNLLDFWSRRIRRLLPAALLVLATTLVASRLVAPETQWAHTAQQIRSAALYSINWRLADDSVDYLAAAAAPSPVQHFWSLAVEEQFYLFWPILILVLVVVARALRRRPNAIVTTGLGAVVLASLAYSVYETSTDPARAYFVTPTRVWELGVGGLLAAWLSRRAFGRERVTEAVALPGGVRVALAWFGLGAIAVSFATYSASTPFPGSAALLPTLGTAAVIAVAAPRGPWSPAALLARRPVQWLGDVSYSVYLWHWPLIVLLPAWTGHPRGIRDDLAVIVGSLVLAALTVRFVERPFRRPAWGRPLLKPFAAAAVGMAIVVAGCGWQLAQVDHRESRARSALQQKLAAPGSCFGAPALRAANCRPTTSGTLTPEPIAAASDRSEAYTKQPNGKDCFAYAPSFAEVTCQFGPAAAGIRIALVGNSHAGQWVGVLHDLATAHGWRLTTYLASRCAFARTAQTLPTAAASRACSRWTASVARDIAAAKYDVVIMTNRISVPAAGASLAGSLPLYERGYRAVLATIRAAGTPVVALRDTPAPGDSVPDCLAAHPQNYAACDGTRSAWLPAEPLTAAVAGLRDGGIVTADLTDRICLSMVCPAVIGGVPVYFDGSHLTNTYARTMAPYLDVDLQRGLRA